MTMKQFKQWQIVVLLLLVALSLQSCLGIGGGNNGFQTKSTGGTQIGVNQTDQAIFQGKIYFTLNRSLDTLDGKHDIKNLTRRLDVRDPAVSPDGKWVAFIIRHLNYSDLAIMPSNGGTIRILLSGNGQFVANPGFAPKSTHNWYAQPSWGQDSKHLLFLSDLAKSTQGPGPGINAFLLDLQAFEISIKKPKATLQAIAYANYGDGGNRDASYRPHHPDQVIYTHYAYDTTNTKQVIQLFLEDANAITNNPGKYRPGATGYEFDPEVALTPATPDLANLQPAFSPDGNSIAYVRRLDATHMGIFVMPVAENVTQNPNDPAVVKKALAPYAKSALLLSGQYISQPAWSPDGTKFAYIGYNNNTFDLWMANVSKDAKSGKYTIKGTPIQLTDTGGKLDADSRPFWTP